MQLVLKTVVCSFLNGIKNCHSWLCANYLNDLKLHLVVSVGTVEGEAYGLYDAVDKQLLRIGTVSRVANEMPGRNKLLNKPLSIGRAGMDKQRETIVSGIGGSLASDVTCRQSNAAVTVFWLLDWHASSKGRKYSSASMKSR